MTDEKQERADRRGSEGQQKASAAPPLPNINFATFIFSLNSSALLSLGVIEDPGSGQRVKNLPLAKQTIDILGMLQEKTKGNLDGDEENLLSNLLYELRLKYVAAKKGN